MGLDMQIKITERVKRHFYIFLIDCSIPRYSYN